MSEITKEAAEKGWMGLRDNTYPGSFEEWWEDLQGKSPSFQALKTLENIQGSKK